MKYQRLTYGVQNVGYINEGYLGSLYRMDYAVIHIEVTKEISQYCLEL